MFQIENFIIFIDYGDAGVILLNYPNESGQILPEIVRKLLRTPSIQLKICKTVNKSWQKVFELLKFPIQVHQTEDQ